MFGYFSHIGVVVVVVVVTKNSPGYFLIPY